MPNILIRLSVTDILLVEKLINNHMKENNIKNIDDIDEEVIQKLYDNIIKKSLWENPQGHIHEK